jgi:hypothetical protein
MEVIFLEITRKNLPDLKMKMIVVFPIIELGLP